MVNQKYLDMLLTEHELWLQGKRGSQLILINEDLRHLSFANRSLTKACLQGCDLRYTNFTNTILYDTNVMLTLTSEIKGTRVIALQVDTTVKNRLIQYWVDFDIVTENTFQGTLDSYKDYYSDNDLFTDRFIQYMSKIIDFLERIMKKEK